MRGRGQGLNWKLQLKEFRGKWGGFLMTIIHLKTMKMGNFYTYSSAKIFRQID